MTEVRVLNENGIEDFKQYLLGLSTDASALPPFELLTDESTSSRLPEQAIVDDRRFATKMDVAKYLFDALKGVNRRHIDHNRGLWTWLALYYFNQLCPTRADGSRKPRREYAYILPKVDSGVEYYRTSYRHLLAGPYQIYRLYCDTDHQGRVLLHHPIGIHGEFPEQLASRMEYVTNRALIEAVDTLYFDKSRGRTKPGATNKDGPGVLRRLIPLLQQLDLTYDLYSLKEGSEIIALLPKEFDKYKKRSKK